MARQRKPQRSLDKEMKKAPFALQLFLDVIMLRSTPLTAVVWGTFLIAVSFHVAWTCGWLEKWGLGGGFDMAGSSARVQQQLAWLVSNDARYFYSVLCRLPDGIAREQIIEHVDRLQAEYKYVANGQAVTFEPCPLTMPPRH